MWTPKGSASLEYLRTQRKITDEVLREFRIGYCPREVQHDLSGRIIMPLFDPRGELVAFTTRDPEAPKRFQHWHESFDKSAYLYGLNNAKQGIKKWDKAIIVEGQFDVMCLHSHGFNMAVGILGTALSILQVIQLARYCSEIYLLFDGDEAGKDSLVRAMKLYDLHYLHLCGIKFIPVPIEGDPDDFVIQNGQQALISIMKKQKEKVLEYAS